MSQRPYRGQGRRPKLTREQYLRVREIKAQRDAIPSDKHLAREFGVSERIIEHAMYAGIQRYERLKEQQ